MNKRAATENNRTIENFFQQKMSHIISLKVTKFQQPLQITLGVADEKSEGGRQKAPSPRDIGLKRVCTLTEEIHRNLSGDHVIFL